MKQFDKGSLAWNVNDITSPLTWVDFTTFVLLNLSIKVILIYDTHGGTQVTQVIDIVVMNWSAN